MSTEIEVAVPVNPANPFASAPIAAAPQQASGQALVAREVGEVQAALVIAKNYPRDQKAAYDRIIMACSRPRLAESATYEYARGGQSVTGPSIRLAEALAVNWGNMLSGVTELSRTGGVSECLAYAWDLETNTRSEKRFQVKHWRDTKKGGYPITDERDIYELIANMGARRMRACILSIVPGDVQEAALDQCNLTMKTTIEITPERIKAMVEKFAEFGVSEAAIEKRIQRRLDTITPALFIGLGRIYTSLKDGMSKASEWFEVDPTPGGGGAPAPSTRTEAIKDQLKRNGAEAPAPHEDEVPAAATSGPESTAEAGPPAPDPNEMATRIVAAAKAVLRFDAKARRIVLDADEAEALGVLEGPWKALDLASLSNADEVLAWLESLEVAS